MESGCCQLSPHCPCYASCVTVAREKTKGGALGPGDKVAGNRLAQKWLTCDLITWSVVSLLRWRRSSDEIKIVRYCKRTRSSRCKLGGAGVQKGCFPHRHFQSTRPYTERPCLPTSLLSNPSSVPDALHHQHLWQGRHSRPISYIAAVSPVTRQESHPQTPARASTLPAPSLH
jgi:hypothetical protein